MIEVMIVWRDGFKSSVRAPANEVVGKVLTQLRRAGTPIPVTLSHDLRDMVYGEDGAINGGVHSFYGYKPYEFIFKRIEA